MNINFLHKLVLKGDWICYKSLKSLRNDIIDCIEYIEDHVCVCNTCKKKLKIKNIESHICNRVNHKISRKTRSLELSNSDNSIL